MSTSTSQDIRCPGCAAHVRAGSDWCTLCYTDLRPEPPAPEPVPVAEPLASHVPVADAVPPPVAAPRGKHARPRTETIAIDPELTADALLARLAAEESGDPLGRFSSQLDTPAKKLALMAGGAAVATVLLFIVMLVVGALL